MSGRCPGQNSGWVFESNQARRCSRPLSQSPVCGRSAEGAGGNEEGKAGVCLHTEPCCVPRSFQHMAEALELTKEKKNNKTSTEKKRCWKSTSHPVWEQFFQTQACVTPPLISNVVKRLSSRFTHCIYDEPEVMTDSPVSICSKRVSML